jgi:hypothetical protein
VCLLESGEKEISFIMEENMQGKATSEDVGLGNDETAVLRIVHSLSALTRKRRNTIAIAQKRS